MDFLCQWHWFLIDFNTCYYRPPTKLREGNVFTDVCLSTGGRVSLVPCPFQRDRVSRKVVYLVGRVLGELSGGMVYPTPYHTSLTGSRGYFGILLACFLVRNCIQSLFCTDDLRLHRNVKVRDSQNRCVMLPKLHTTHSQIFTLLEKHSVTHCFIITARKRNLGQGNIFTGMCQSFCIISLPISYSLFYYSHPVGKIFSYSLFYYSHPVGKTFSYSLFYYSHPVGTNIQLLTALLFSPCGNNIQLLTVLLFSPCENKHSVIHW